MALASEGEVAGSTTAEEDAPATEEAAPAAEEEAPAPKAPTTTVKQIMNVRTVTGSGPGATCL